MESQTDNNLQEHDLLKEERSPVRVESVLPRRRQVSRHPRMNWRLASRLSVITFAILVVVVVTVIQQLRSSANGSNAALLSNLQATDLGNQPAPNFQLTDQAGQKISLAQFKGKPVVLTFLYTHCPDICPLTAEHLH